LVVLTKIRLAILQRKNCRNRRLYPINSVALLEGIPNIVLLIMIILFEHIETIRLIALPLMTHYPSHF